MRIKIYIYTRYIVFPHIRNDSFEMNKSSQELQAWKWMEEERKEEEAEKIQNWIEGERQTHPLLMRVTPHKQYAIVYVAFTLKRENNLLRERISHRS